MPAWVNLANLFTFARLALTPFILRDIIDANHTRALILFFIAALTDVIDGALARGPSGATRFGAYFDPTADKCLMSGVFLALGAAEIVPWWFVAVVLGRDLFILAGALAALGLTKVRQFPPSRWGKLSTFVQIVTAISWMVRDAWPAPVFIAISSAMLWVCATFTVISGLDYARRGTQLFRAR
ncbi:MAG TPA: CDP-alcohol phosphatidyltransferase family protein [Candidatus Acidoferrum sp.]|jgi:cardiolipin synthase|nr:CDP-alcohol phosphatidyltransferase family protein [Candidatus Acidoferrum sp.]